MGIIWYKYLYLTVPVLEYPTCTFFYHYAEDMEVVTLEIYEEGVA